MTAIEITARQRDLLYERIWMRLSGIDSVWQAARDEDFQRADRYAREFADMLRFLVDDLGWGEERGHPVELRSSAEVIAGVARSVLASAEAEDRDEAAELAALEKSRRANRALRALCRQLIEGAVGT